MKDGLYKMQFTTPLGSGGGVVVKSGTQLMGGDSGYAWIGTISNDAGRVTASAQVSQHDITIGSVFGPLSKFGVILDGTMTGDSGVLKGTSPDVPGVTLSLQLTLLKAAA